MDTQRIVQIVAGILMGFYYDDFNFVKCNDLLCGTVVMYVVFVCYCLYSENMTYLRQRFDELLDVGDTLSVKSVSTEIHLLNIISFVCSFMICSCLQLVLIRAVCRLHGGLVVTCLTACGVLESNPVELYSVFKNSGSAVCKCSCSGGSSGSSYFTSTGSKVLVIGLVQLVVLQIVVVVQVKG